MAFLDRIAEAARTLKPDGLLGRLAYAVLGEGVMAQNGAGRDPTKATGFTIAVIALSAKMAKADGLVTRDEVAAFRQVFDFPQAEMHHVARMFDLARQDVAGFDLYARDVRRILRGDAALLEDVLHGLFYIAQADGIMHENELLYLEAVSEIFKLDPKVLARLKAIYVPSEDGIDPYAVLGVAQDADDVAIKKAWRDLARENHPDALIARGVPEEFMRQAGQKLAAINDAYDLIKTARGLA